MHTLTAIVVPPDMLPKCMCAEIKHPDKLLNKILCDVLLIFRIKYVPHWKNMHIEVIGRMPSSMLLLQCFISVHRHISSTQRGKNCSKQYVH